MLKSSVNNVLAFVKNELESSSRCLRYRAMHQKLLMNGFISDVRVFDFERTYLPVVDQTARHSLTRRTYISTDHNQLFT